MSSEDQLKVIYHVAVLALVASVVATVWSGSVIAVLFCIALFAFVFVIEPRAYPQG